jgi:hypothetical protein
MTQARRRSPTPVLGPWALADIVALSINTAVGMLLIGVAWDRTSGLVGVRDQVPWLNVAIGGVVIIAAGNTAWFLRGRRAVGQRRSGTLPTARGGMRVRGACAQASVVPSQYLDQAAESGTDFVAARTIFVAARIMITTGRNVRLLLARPSQGQIGPRTSEQAEGPVGSAASEDIRSLPRRWPR